jgi:transcriptional regulator GlxA family with amidase domain
MILAAAGLLNGRRTTAHWLAAGPTAGLGRIRSTEWVVFGGEYVTAAGVSAGIDMGLALAAVLRRPRRAARGDVTRGDAAPDAHTGSERGRRR